MTIELLVDGDLVLVGVEARFSTEETAEFRDELEDWIDQHLGVRVSVALITQAAGLFRALRKDDGKTS